MRAPGNKKRKQPVGPNTRFNDTLSSTIFATLQIEAKLFFCSQEQRLETEESCCWDYFLPTVFNSITFFCVFEGSFS